jgi:uncharacterized protein
VLAVELLATNLAQPALAFFALGAVAVRLRSDLAVPDQISKALALYLLVAIGFKGGVQLRADGLSLAFGSALGAALALSLLIPLIAFALLMRATPVGRTNAAAIAAHYGSVSLVTFIAATMFLAALDVPYEGFMVTLLAAMEAPAIVLGLALARRSTGAVTRESFTNGSVLLLLGAIAIGLLTGDAGLTDLEGFLIAPFKGVLALFLLDMGLVATRQLGAFRGATWRLIAFGLSMPLIGAVLGVATGALVGLSLGGTTLLGVLAASASYIAAPAAMRHSLPEADASLYLGLSLGVTFPFNLALGIPLCYALAGVVT